MLINFVLNSHRWNIAILLILFTNFAINHHTILNFVHWHLQLCWKFSYKDKTAGLWTKWSPRREYCRTHETTAREAEFRAVVLRLPRLKQSQARPKLALVSSAFAQTRVSARTDIYLAEPGERTRPKQTGCPGNRFLVTFDFPLSQQLVVAARRRPEIAVSSASRIKGESMKTGWLIFPAREEIRRDGTERVEEREIFLPNGLENE